MGLLSPRWRILHFPLLNFMTLVWAHFSSLLRSFSMAGLSSGESAAPPSVVPPVNLLKVHSPPSLIINEDVNLDWAQCWSLGNTDAHWSPSRLLCCWSPPSGLSQFSIHPCLLLQPIYEQLLYEYLMEHSVKGLTDMQTENIHLLSPYTGFDLVIGWPWLSATDPNLSLSHSPSSRGQEKIGFKSSLFEIKVV